ncbi:hypothetical protein JAAARDRAFT_199805 [Jaapia argillacea MUCL 33604]|uniref:Uncharacterized protein n=1 Tax=Jaapia argillacea MUCL 33604 TaxID=933084 RepID=A0A067P7C2_9AGAM|nr:hypothetical protein JAAARDRAFT_199805 [Jaapia argillacea MUCL 33604]
MLSVVNTIYLYNRITPTAHFFISPRYTRNDQGEVVDRADVIECKRALVANTLQRAGYLQASLWTLRPKGASYHPNSPTYSNHESDYQPVSPLLSALGDSYFESTTISTEDQTCPPYNEHPPASPADAPNPCLPTPHPFAPAGVYALIQSEISSHPSLPSLVSVPETPMPEWPSLPTPPNEPTPADAWGSGWMQERVDEWNETRNQGWNKDAIVDSESIWPQTNKEKHCCQPKCWGCRIWGHTIYCCKKTNHHKHARRSPPTITHQNSTSNPPLPSLHWSAPTISFTHRLGIKNQLFDFVMEQVSSSATKLRTTEWTHSYWIKQGKRLVGSDGLLGPQLPTWYPTEPAPFAPKA